MEDLIPVAEAASELGVTPRVLEWCYRKGLLQLHKRIGVRSNLVSLTEARGAVAARQPVGRPKRAEKQPPA